MASRVCWYCGTYAHMTPVGNALRIDHPHRMFMYDRSIVFGFFQCDECKMPSIAHIVHENKNLGYTDNAVMLDIDPEWLPAQGVGKVFEDVPEHIAGPASEAYACHSIGAYRGAIILARAVVEATAKAKGVVKGRNLHAKIETLFDEGHISPLIKDTAHGIRDIGNNMAHGDFEGADVTEEDAALTLALMDMALAHVFQEPAKVAKLTKRREEKKTGTGPSEPVRAAVGPITVTSTTTTTQS